MRRQAAGVRHPLSLRRRRGRLGCRHDRQDQHEQALQGDRGVRRGALRQATSKRRGALPRRGCHRAAPLPRQLCKERRERGRQLGAARCSGPSVRAKRPAARALEAPQSTPRLQLMPPVMDVTLMSPEQRSALKAQLAALDGHAYSRFWRPFTPNCTKRWTVFGHVPTSDRACLVRFKHPAWTGMYV